MKTEIRDITPKVAMDMLKRNVSNRKLSKAHANFLAKEMMIGNWTFDGQPIRFSEAGGLLDGQHRLTAIVESDSTQKFLVVTGINSEAFAVMDTGKNRSGGDVFSINGVKNPNSCAAATKIILLHHNGRNSTRGGLKGRVKPSNTDLINYFNEHKDIEQLVADSNNLYLSFQKILSLSVIAGYKYLMAERDVVASEDFWRKVCTGLGLEEGSPIIALRNKLMQDKMSKASLPATEKKAIIFKAWNAYRKGEKVQFLRWNKENESFPELI